MKKRIRRILSLLLFLALLFGMLPSSGMMKVYATETEPVAAGTEESTEVPAMTGETTSGTEASPSSESETEAEPEASAEEDTEPSKADEPPRDPATGYGRPTGTVEELETIPVPDEILASTYNLQIPVILYGTTTFTVSFKYPSDPAYTTYTTHLSGFRYHYLNGQMAYCLEPQAGSTAGAVYSQIAGGSDLNVWERFLSISQRNAIALALAYGAPNGLNSTTKLTLHGYEAATQVIIWEMIIGYRNTVAPFACTNSGLYNFVLNLCNTNDSTGALRAAYINGYNSIVSSMQSHGVIPSFASKKQAQAPEHEMTYDAASGLYRIILTDSNNAINNDFPYTSSNGLTFTKSENRLTVTATAEALQNQPVMVSATGSDPDTDSVSPVIWGTTNSNHNVGQILSQLAKPDPVHVYFKLKASTTTNLTIQKVCEDGNISGLTFTVADSSGNVLFTGQTDQNGKLNVPNLEVGKTITITETVPENYVAENRVQTVTLAASGNNVTFRNYPLGTATMMKVSEKGDVAGYCFNLYRHKDGSNGSKTWHGKSDTDGRVYETDSDFNILGDEKSFVFLGLTDGKYSFRELLSLHGAGNVWPESITFTTGGGSTPACNLSFTGDQLVAQENGDCTVSGIALTGLDGGGT
ncbi:MAG: Cys-Gln thioester bond-forming surface protein, partial [Oscillospiraceae bacterium]|nr:Cys-Gln thioester bond-forming surface protein [Oscillospiraceae bacterium]